MGNPIVSIIGVNTPSDDLNSVIAQEAVGGWLINTGTVIVEVSVDSHPGGDGAVGLEILLNCGNRLVVHDGLGLGVVESCSVGACRWALLLDTSILVASLRRCAIGNQVIPSVAWITSIAARLVGCAIEEVLCGTWDQRINTTSNAKSVFEGFDSCKGPACTALSLVSDGTDA